jgi:hypothetical protein
MQLYLLFPFPPKTWLIPLWCPRQQLSLVAELNTNVQELH